MVGRAKFAGWEWGMMAKSDHLLAIMWLLRSRGRLTAEELAERLEVSVRSIYRYIDALCASGVPIVAEPGHGGGFTLPAEFHEAPLFFDTTELKALAHAGKFARRAGYPYTAELDRMLEKVEIRLSLEQAEELDRHASSLEVASYADVPVDEYRLRLLEGAVAARKAVRIKYEKWAGGACEQREVEPYAVIYRHFRWYLVTYCRLRADFRTFRADRIVAVTETGEDFARDGSFSVEAFLERLAPAPDVSGPSVAVRLEGEPWAIDRICDHWFLREEVTERSETQASFSLPASGVASHMPTYLLGYGLAVTVLEPVSLCEHMAKLAVGVARRYGAELE